MSKQERVARVVLGSPLLGAGLVCWGLGHIFREQDEFSSIYCVLAEKRVTSPDRDELPTSRV
jgi:hypothetical protein